MHHNPGPTDASGGRQDLRGPRGSRVLRPARLWAVILAVALTSCTSPKDLCTVELLGTHEAGYESDLDDDGIKISAFSAVGRWSRDPMSLSVTVPYVRLADVEAKTSGSGGLQADEDVDGLGDMMIAAQRYVIGDHATGAYAGVTAEVKLPTGDEDDGLGTGEADFSLGLMGGYGGNSVRPFWRATRTFVGDPSDRNLRDVWSFSGGLAAQLSRRNAVTLMVDGRDTLEPGESGFITGYVYYRRELSLRSWLVVMSYFGLNEAAADYGFALGWGMTFRPSVGED